MRNENISTNDLSTILQVTKTYLSLLLNKAEYEEFTEKKGRNLIIDLDNFLIKLKFNKFDFEYEKDDSSSFVDRLKVINKTIVQQHQYLSASQVKKYVADINHYNLRLLRDSGKVKFEYRAEENSKERYFYETNSIIKYFNKRPESKLNEYSIYPTKQFYTIEEYLEKHEIGIYKLRKKMKEDEIPSIKIGTIYRIPILESNEIAAHIKKQQRRKEMEKKELLTPTHNREKSEPKEKKKYKSKRRSFNYLENKK